MALIKCSECGKEISDQATSCPGCGAPIGKATPPIANQKKKTSPVAWAALIALVIGGIWLQVRNSKEQSLPTLPAEVHFRNALLGSGMVLQVKNTSNKPLMVMATLKNPTTKQEKSFRLDISPNGATEVGHVEGWVLASGDQIKVFNANFKTWEGSIP